MPLEHQREHGSGWEVIGSVAEKLGPTAEPVHKWVRRAEIDGRARAGRTPVDHPVPCRRSLPGVAPVHSPLVKVSTPFTKMCR